jgi:hypothetical protein
MLRSVVSRKRVIALAPSASFRRHPAAAFWSKRAPPKVQAEVLNPRVVSSTKPSDFQRARKWAYDYNKKTTWKYKWARKILRAVQLGVLSFSLMQAGYASGLTDYAQDPKGMDMVLVRNMVQDTIKFKGGAGSADHLHDVADSKWRHGLYSKEHHQVEAVGLRILHGARRLCKIKIEELHRKMDQAGKSPGKSVDTKGNESTLLESVLLGSSDLQEECKMWESNLAKLSGHWDFIVTKDSRIVNAFVSELCPRRIFVHDGLLKTVEPNEHELAMILGHEVSHLLLGHNSSKMGNTVLIAALQLVFLTFIDPTDILSIALEYAGYRLSGMYSASYSRQCESEADELGIQIAAQACFDTRRGANVMNKLAKLDGSRKKHVSWDSSHPSSSDRYAALLKASETHHPKLLKGNCKTCGDGYKIATRWLHF